MLKLEKIAITGGLSCGKSSVCRFLSQLGAYVASSDNIVHQLLSTDTKLGQEIINLLGTKILVDQKINRSLVAEIVFQDFDLLQALEKITHPVVYNEIDKEFQKQERKYPQPALFVAEIPLLFESDCRIRFDSTVVVIANEEVCIKRFKETNRSTFDQYKKRVSRQIPILEKAKLADYVLINEGSLLDLKEKTLDLYRKLTKDCLH